LKNEMSRRATTEQEWFSYIVRQEKNTLSEAEYWDSDWAGSPAEPANNFARRAYKLIEAHNLRSVLDLGCGNGRDSVYFFRKGLQVTALDFSQSGINILKSRFPEIECITADIREMDFQGDSYDVIYAHLSLQYFNDKLTGEIFNSLHNVLKNGGLFFVKCKSTDDYLSGKGEKIGENMYKRGHVRHFFSKEYMMEKLHRFRIISVRRTTSLCYGRRSSFIEAMATK
jgi:SAM-dependent methyltransferase